MTLLLPLAQLTPAEPAAVGLWLAILGGILGVVWLALQIWEKISPRAVPPLHETFATKKELKESNDMFEKWIRELTTRIDANRSEVRDEINAFIRQTIESQEKIHDRINEILRAVSEIRGRCETHYLHAD